ncbi:MAG: histidine phosphatase family protein [Lachnospiraceae bacterium]|nr:histidine phosphatase family protein [Lachnospiraceae bacterium]
MKLLFIRHGDPEYVTDSLTERGKKEAELLAKRMEHTHVDKCYVSPLGRARLTAKPCLEKLGMEATEYDWLEEFSPKIHRPDSPDREHISWDWLPQDWTARDCFYDRNDWWDDEILKEGHVRERAEYVWNGIDGLLKDHGYERDGRIYRAVRPNNDTIALFCHFGVTALMLSHMLGCSPMILWHGMIAAPTSVTTVYTEERRKGIASFRITSFGDVYHLYEAGIDPSFSGRFCECYDNEGERRD